MLESSRRTRWLWPSLLVLSLFAPGAAITASARDYDPHIMYLFPAGGQQGTTVEGVMTRGRGLEGTSEIRISGAGVSAQVLAIEEPDTRLLQRSKNRQDQAENPNVVKFSVTIAPDAPLGARDLWLITPKGATNRMRFVVGQLAEVLEVDDETEAADARQLPELPVTVNGQYNQGDRDTYRFSAKAGQTLVCAVQGRQLKPYIPDAVPGWFQPCLTLFDSSGAELQFADDWRFHPDPVLLFEVPQDGDYELEIRDALYRGREDLVYRLTIGVVPFVTHLFPLGGRRGTDVDVQLHGVNLPVAATTISIPEDAPPELPIQVGNQGLLSNALPFAAGDDPEVLEAEPNDRPQQAQPIEPPVVINGRIQHSGDLDHFVFRGQKGQQVVFDLCGRRLDSPIDSSIDVLDAKGRPLASADDTKDASAGLITHHADSYLKYRITEDGEYAVRVRDIQSHGGDAYAYRLSIRAPRPDFQLRVFPANLSVPRGASAVAKVKAYRRDGFREEIDLQFAGFPDGFTISPAVIPAGQDEVRFTVTASGDAELGVYSPDVSGSASIAADRRGGADQDSAGRVLRRDAAPAEELMQAFYYWHDVPADQYLVSVVEQRSFSLSLKEASNDVRELLPRTSWPVSITVSRDGLDVAIAQAQTEQEAAAAAAASAAKALAQARAEGSGAGKAAGQAAGRAARNANRSGDASRRARSTARGANATIASLNRAKQAADAALAAANRHVQALQAAAKAPILLSADSPPAGIAVKGGRIGADETEGTIVISANDKAAVGARHNIIISGTIRVAGEAMTCMAPAIPVRVVAGEKPAGSADRKH